MDTYPHTTEHYVYLFIHVVLSVIPVIEMSP